MTNDTAPAKSQTSETPKVITIDDGQRLRTADGLIYVASHVKAINYLARDKETGKLLKTGLTKQSMTLRREIPKLRGKARQKALKRQRQQLRAAGRLSHRLGLVEASSLPAL